MISKSYNQLEKDLDIAVKALEVKESLVNALKDKANQLERENGKLKVELADLKALCIHQESRLNRAGD